MSHYSLGVFGDEKESVVIFLTGLGEINMPEAEDAEGRKLITAMLDKLISQFPKETTIKIVSFEQLTGKKENYKNYENSVRQTIQESAFAKYIKLSFRDALLEPGKDGCSDAFVLNFAGNEIEGALLNDRRFVDASLYITNPKERDVILSNLQVIKDPETKRDETPFFVCRGHVLDRRNCYIQTRDGSRIVYHDHTKLMKAKEKLSGATNEEEKKEAKKEIKESKFITLKGNADLIKQFIK